MKLLRLLFFVFSSALLATSCKEKTSTSPTTDGTQKDTTETVKKDEMATAGHVPPMAPISDSGQSFFKVAVYKNGKPFAQYQGDWAIAFQAGKNMNIQFPASKRMLKIDHGLTMYFNSPSEGKFEIAPSGNEKEKPVVIFGPAQDGAAGISISAQSGTISLTKFADGLISGNIEGAGKDEKGEPVIIQVAFINIKNNISE